MPFGPSQNEALLYFQLPLLISLVLAVCLLFGWRRFLALLGATLAFAIFVAAGISSLDSFFGAMMLLFSGWVAVVFLSLALFLSTRKR